MFSSEATDSESSASGIHGGGQCAWKAVPGLCIAVCSCTSLHEPHDLHDVHDINLCILMHRYMYM